ncbi:protein bark beetle isoform X2 [Bemisia tabaci]
MVNVPTSGSRCGITRRNSSAFAMGLIYFDISDVLKTCAILLVGLCAVGCEDFGKDPSWYQYSTVATTTFSNQITELAGGTIINKQLRLERHMSPYLVRDDLIIDRSGELIIDPGVELRFSPMIGITVRGVLTAQGTEYEPIILTSSREPAGVDDLPQVRLVDGPSILAGRLQIFHNGEWRSVCTNSRNWTRSDMETICRQMGFQGGNFWNWIDRLPGVTKSRLLLEEPKCRGTELSITECDWASRQLGSGVCDFHPDLGIECLPYHETKPSLVQHWRGITFQNAKHERTLAQRNTLYVQSSLSRLSYVQIRYGGSGRDYNATSALQIEGVPPKMQSVSVLFSAYNGLNISSPDSPVVLSNCTIRSNRGYGVYVNSSTGMALLDGCLINENGADGVKYVHHDVKVIENRQENFDLCEFPTTASQTFPINVFVQQNLYSTKEQSCSKYFFTRAGHVLTIHFLTMTASRNNSGYISVFDGTSSSDTLLARFDVRNGTKPQSITTTRNNVYISFSPQARTHILGHMKIVSGYNKWYDLNVTDTTIADNNGRGIIVENIRSMIHVQRTSVSNNNHVAGVHILGGAGDVNISESRIAFNKGDGVNISYAGGNQNVSHSSISSNSGFGFAVWFNDSKQSDYKVFKQETDMGFSEIFRNLEIGVLIGNFCREHFVPRVNITGNYFNLSMNHAIEIKTCLKENSGKLKLRIGNNEFVNNHKLGIKITPAVNMDGLIEFNRFTAHQAGTIFIKNPSEVDEYNVFESKLVLKNNEFYDNQGSYVLNIGLSPYSESQNLLFTWNFLRGNRIREPFSGSDSAPKKLIPRSRAAAVLVISSANVQVFRNILQNHDSVYEIASHLEDQSQIINCTYNWLGHSNEDKIFERLFHRKDRYNLAKIEYLPYLLHSSNPGATTIMSFSLFVPHFHLFGSGVVGGEVEGVESLRAGEYSVVRDISIRPGARLSLEPGVTLRFPPGVGMMVAGKLEARGRGPNDIRLTLKEERVDEPIDLALNETDAEPIPVPESTIPVRLLGGRSSSEGRLQVKVGEKWGTVCNYGWTMRDAAVVCNQLGLILNPDDWLLTRNEIPHAGLTEDILLNNVRCTEDDFDITQCQSERLPDFENSCTHNDDVGLRCYEPKWAGIRLGVLAERCDLQYITIEQAGLLDYATNELKPALQIDFSHHVLENVRVINNIHDGLGVVYSDIYSQGSVNTIKNSEFNNNRGSGVSFKQLGMKIMGSSMENNKVAGIRHHPRLDGLQQREIAGWFKPLKDVATQYSPYNPIFIPFFAGNVDIEEKETKYFITQRVLTADPIKRTFFIRSQPGYVLGLQLLSPIHNRSTENIFITDSHVQSTKAAVWNVKRDLSVFPTTSTSFGVAIEYHSGNDALGGAVLVVSSLPAPIQNIPNRIVKGPVPSLVVYQSRIKGNQHGLWNTYYNRYLTEIGEHYFRKSNESISILNCDISHNIRKAFYINSPHWSLKTDNISEITITINNTMITDNAVGIHQKSRDLHRSNNLFHWFLHHNTIERNGYGGFEIELPYVWQYNENYTHSVRLENNTWRNNNKFSVLINGHYAETNLTNNIFLENHCLTGLVSISGMEKKLLIKHNTIERNVGTFMIEFKIDSQSEIMGQLPANFIFNVIRLNSPPTADVPSSVIVFDGLQRVRVRRNLLSDNSLAYIVVAGVQTARINDELDMTENWWGTIDPVEIKHHIFDFDDWNDHAYVRFRPFLIENSHEGSLSVSWEQPAPVNLDNLSGRITKNLVLYPKGSPYVIESDITVMPDTELVIRPGVVMEFAPRVGILVLGTLIARGRRNEEIVMRPLTNRPVNEKPLPIAFNNKKSYRLCLDRNCTDTAQTEGFLEYWNTTTLQWVPMCDPRFTERNAQVVCRELGLPSLNAWVSHGQRVEFQPNALARIWSFPEPLQCSGDENKLEDCPTRLNVESVEERPTCAWNSNFVFVKCLDGTLPKSQDYWGGIRFTNSEFETVSFESRIHNTVTHETVTHRESALEYVRIEGAGRLHHTFSPAILAIGRSPSITSTNITHSASHGISFISPLEDVRMLFNWIQSNVGLGITVASLTGEGRESSESSFTPLHHVHLPYRAFSMINICDPNKELVIQERVLLYYKYDNSPINCVKIFYSALGIKPFGFRLLQFNLFNTTDSLHLYDGSIYNVSAKSLGSVSMDSGSEKKFITTTGPILSVKLSATGASEMHGFIAEIVTLPISAIGFNRDVQHNVSFSVIKSNVGGALHYASAGEVNPRITLEWNQITDNCKKLFGNFTTCQSAVMMELQNTQNLHFRNNLVSKNQGGLWVRADSRGSATSLKGWIHNNLFTDNYNLPALSVEGRQSSPYQEVTIYRNYFTQNLAPYRNVIVLKQVVSNFTYNYVHNNFGFHILEVSGFERVRLPIYQTTSHNGFYWNQAAERDIKGTIIAGTAGQHYVDNILFNPDNDYEIVTVNRSIMDVWKTPIDARHNYWGYNETLAVSGRIRDRSDQIELLEVNYLPYQMNNLSILDVKCPPGWNLVGDTCYIYVGAPMTFYEARDFCRSDNATMPYVMSNYVQLYQFLRHQQATFNYYDHVWVQHIDHINECTSFAYQKVQIDHCLRLNPFLCEMDPKVVINLLSWRDDTVTLAVLGSVGLCLLLISLLVGFWFSKSRHRHIERLERRNSIRQSLQSVRSFSQISNGGFPAGEAYKRKPITMIASHRDSPRLDKELEKMNESDDSIEKSQLHSSGEEDTQSYDIYEAHNLTAAEAVNPRFDLAFHNEGYRDNSTFASRDNSTWHSTDDTFNANSSSTLPILSGYNTKDPLQTRSTPQVAPHYMDYQQEPEYQIYYERPKSSTILETNMDELPVPQQRSQSECLLDIDHNATLPSNTKLVNLTSSFKPLLETNLDEPPLRPNMSKSEDFLKIKSQLNGDAKKNGGVMPFKPISDKSKSMPFVETSV